jgi:hypothetical protein
MFVDITSNQLTPGRVLHYSNTGIDDNAYYTVDATNGGLTIGSGGTSTTNTGIKPTGVITQTGVTGGTCNSGSANTFVTGTGGAGTDCISGAGGAMSFTTGTAGATDWNQLGVSTGGNGGTYTFTAGNGGQSTNINISGTTAGGTGGAYTFTAGTGGIAITRNGVNGISGTGGSITLTAGTGGATSGTTNRTTVAGNGGALTLTTGNGGSAASGQNSTAGNSGALTLSIGTPGTVTSATNTRGIGANAGSISLTGSIGGTATGTNGNNSAGNGSSITLRAGNGGIAINGKYNYGGNGGNLTLISGGIGTGNTSNGTAGYIVFKNNATVLSTLDSNGLFTFINVNVTNNLNVTGNITANYFIGNGSLLTSVCLSNGSNCASLGGGNPFDQSLNTTDGVTFNNGTFSSGIYDNAATSTLSINPNTRILYASDGTTPVIAYDNSGSGGALSFSSNAAIFSTAMEDGSGYDSIDVTNRELYDNAGAFVVNWETQSRLWGGTDGSGNYYYWINFNDATMGDPSGVHIDWANTILYASSITYPAINWGTDTAIQFPAYTTAGILVNDASGVISSVVATSDCYDSALGGQVCGYFSSVTDDPSDKSFKDNIQNLTLDLNKFSQLKPSTWNWNNNYTGKQGQSATGLIADDLQSVYPSLIKEGSHKEVIGYKNVTKVVYVNQTTKDMNNKTIIIQVPKNITSSEAIWNVTNYKTIDYAGVIALQTKKIQELESQINCIKAAKDFITMGLC